MKVTFVYPDIQPRFRFWKGHYYSGIGYLSAFLRNYGHSTSLIHITQPISKETFTKYIFDENPDLIGFSSTSHSFPIVERLAGWIKEENLQIPTICGGIHPTISPDETINTEGINIICRGEGEEALLELCNNMEKSGNIRNIPNIWYRNKRVVYKNPLRPPYQNLNNLPFPDRSIFTYKDLFHENQGYATVMVSRGCPYQCSYCCNHYLNNLYDHKAKYIRFLSPDTTVLEIKQIVKDFPFIRAIHFDDDILFITENWGKDFLTRYKDEVGLPFRCNERPNLMTRTKAEAMREAGCNKISIGLESGNDYIRNKVLNRNLNNDQIKTAFHFCKNAKIRTKSFNMVGIPYEDPRAILDTIKLNAEMSVDEIQATIFQPYQGTKLFDLCLEKGFLTKENLSLDFFSPAPLLLDTITPEQVLMFRNYFRVFVRIYKVLYGLPKAVSGFLIKSTDVVLSSKYICKLLNTIYFPLNFIYRLYRLKFSTP